MGWIKTTQRIACLGVLALGVDGLLGCESKVKAPESGATPEPKPALEPDPEPVAEDPADSADKDKPTKKPSAPAPAPAPLPPPPKPQEIPDAVHPGDNQSADEFMSGITSYTDKNIPLPPGAKVRIKNLQISDAPVSQIGQSAHFRMKGGIFMSR